MIILLPHEKMNPDQTGPSVEDDTATSRTHGIEVDLVDLLDVEMDGS
jgi:hypothetical protein